MQTFSEILEALPGAEVKQLVWVRRIYVGLLFCIAAFAVLMGLGWYLKSLSLIKAGFIPIALALIGLAAQMEFEVRDVRRMVADSAAWIGGRLDQ